MPRGRKPTPKTHVVCALKTDGTVGWTSDSLTRSDALTLCNKKNRARGEYVRTYALALIVPAHAKLADGTTVTL